MAATQGFGPAVQEGPAVTGALDAGADDPGPEDPEAGDPPVGVGPAEHGVVGLALTQEQTAAAED